MSSELDNTSETEYFTFDNFGGIIGGSKVAQHDERRTRSLLSNGCLRFVTIIHQLNRRSFGMTYTLEVNKSTYTEDPDSLIFFWGGQNEFG